MAAVVALVPDLMFGTRIEDAVRHLGYSIEFLSGNDDPETVIARASPTLVIVALDAPGWASVVAAGKRAGARVLAFGSHRNVEMMQAAKTAGCDQVVARSQMAADLLNLLSRNIR